MSQTSIEENIDYIINYNLYFAPKKQLYQYLHQIALATNKTEVADVYMNAISELSPDNASEHTIPQHVESELLESIIEVTKKFECYKEAEKLIEEGFYLRTTEFKALDDSPSTWFKSLKESRTPKDNGAMQALVICALVSGNPEVIKFALKENYNPNAPLIFEAYSALLWAATFGHTECVKALLAASADIKAKDKDGWTALMNAACNGHTECVKALLAAKAEVNNAKEKDGHTALMIAAQKEDAECVKALLAAGADINAKDKDGQTALMHAASDGRTECVKALLAAKAEVNAQDKKGQTALMRAATRGWTECVKALLAAKAEVNAKDKDGHTALMKAANYGRTECVKALLAAKAEVNAKDKDGWTALMFAPIKGHAECVTLLLAAEAEVNAKDKDGRTSLMFAAQEGHAECVTLLAAKAEVNAKDKNGWTALMFAASNGRTECIKVLLSAKANINAKEKDGWTALMIAAYNGRTECVKTLLEEGADWQQKSNKGNTASVLAFQSKKSNDATRNLLSEKEYQLSKKQNFWNKCYSFTNIVIAVIFIAWVSISIWQKWSINGSGIDITLYIIGCLVPLIFKAYLSYRANIYRPDNRTACIAYGVADFFCAMALCLPAISNKILDSFSGVVWLSMLVQLAIAVFLGNRAYKMRYEFLYDLSPRTICVWNVIITITLFYLGGGVLTGTYNFWDNLFAALTLGY